MSSNSLQSTVRRLVMKELQGSRRGMREDWLQASATEGAAVVLEESGAVSSLSLSGIGIFFRFVLSALGKSGGVAFLGELQQSTLLFAFFQVGFWEISVFPLLAVSVFSGCLASPEQTDCCLGLIPLKELLTDLTVGSGLKGAGRCASFRPLKRWRKGRIGAGGFQGAWRCRAKAEINASCRL